MNLRRLAAISFALVAGILFDSDYDGIAIACGIVSISFVTSLIRIAA